ncbi:hypothetical protein [Deinococcus radiophilus]|uniref:Uncharacterized protein n=1 Tax=Deinococcus radiophilus TaxID=32062 RepID=A0A431VR75_9DEIO|nr:hypothetical protein [Deinococcus radiophilus]RTR25706.1 hypothetical protein EJ104_09750 [Deinococcus radiophilus]UFA50221.1 hypothetical protein LMT64_10140 [Deinococcus radiophilus]
MPVTRHPTWLTVLGVLSILVGLAPVLGSVPLPYIAYQVWPWLCALGLGLLLWGALSLLLRGWRQWRSGQGASGLFHWAGVALLTFPVALLSAIALASGRGDWGLTYYSLPLSP